MGYKEGEAVRLDGVGFTLFTNALNVVFAGKLNGDLPLSIYAPESNLHMNDWTKFYCTLLADHETSRCSFLEHRGREIVTINRRVGHE